MKEQGLQVRSSFFVIRNTYLSRSWQLKISDTDLYVELINKNMIVYHSHWSQSGRYPIQLSASSFSLSLLLSLRLD